ncbi:hypothetical protein BDV12DRAFT_195408 [Aspergillus spectabilis]
MRWKLLSIMLLLSGHAQAQGQTDAPERDNDRPTNVTGLGCPYYSRVGSYVILWTYPNFLPNPSLPTYFNGTLTITLNPLYHPYAHDSIWGSNEFTCNKYEYRTFVIMLIAGAGSEKASPRRQGADSGYVNPIFLSIDAWHRNFKLTNRRLDPENYTESEQFRLRTTWYFNVSNIAEYSGEFIAYKLYGRMIYKYHKAQELQLITFGICDISSADDDLYLYTGFLIQPLGQIDYGWTDTIPVPKL